MGGIDAPKDAPKDPTQQLGDFMPDATQLGEDVDGPEIDAVFDKLADLQNVPPKIDRAETQRLRASISLEAKIAVLAPKEEQLIGEIRNEKDKDKKAKLTTELEKVQADLNPLREQKGRLETAFQTKLYDEIIPGMKKTIKDGGPGNVTLLGATEAKLRTALAGQRPNATTIAKDFYDMFNNAPESQGGMGGNAQKVAEKLAKSRTAFNAFKKRVDAVAKAYTDVVPAIDRAKKA